LQDYTVIETFGRNKTMLQHYQAGAAHCIGLIGVSLSRHHQRRETIMPFVRRDEKRQHHRPVRRQPIDLQTESLAVIIRRCKPIWSNGAAIAAAKDLLSSSDPRRYVSRGLDRSPGWSATDQCSPDLPVPAQQKRSSTTEHPSDPEPSRQFDGRRGRHTLIRNHTCQREICRRGTRT